MKTVLCHAALLLGLMASSRPVRAQEYAERPQLLAGTDVRILTFDRLAGVQRLRQVTTPVGAVIPLGRLTVDVGSAWVSTSLVRSDATRHVVEAFTDTQLRATYLFGRDALAATVLLNLPTGPSEASARDYSVIGAVSPNLLGFPVAAYASGFSVTSGLAMAVPLGKWSLGAAGSLRASSRFTPYADAGGSIAYKPGIETRLRGALDGLVGSSRIALGLTYSTFGDDQFGKTTTARGRYAPGPRWIAETALTSPLAGGTLNLSLWNFRRLAGDTTGASIRNRENLAGAEISFTVPVSRGLSLEPSAMARISKPETGEGRMAGLGIGGRLQLGRSISFAPLVRLDRGWIEDGAGVRSRIHGVYGEGQIQLSF